MSKKIYLLLLLLPLIFLTKPTAADPAATQDSPRRVHAIVTGKVQGVGFRAFVQEHGNALKLVGWVKNLPDGTVETVVEGPAGAVGQLLDFIHKGPTASRVDDVKVTEEKPTGEFKSFDVQ